MSTNDGETPQSGETQQTDSIKGPVGFIGLGNIGAPIATRLLDWPGGLVVFDVSPDATAGLAERGAEVASSAAEVARLADLVCVMVNTEAQVRGVLTGPDGIIAGAARRQANKDGVGRSGLVVAVLSTISPHTAHELGAAAQDGGVSLLDVPVSGGAMGAHSGTLALMVGGDADAFSRCREPFEMIGSLVHHFGPLGAGTRAKLVRNLITFASYVAVGEASRIAEAAGIDLLALGEVVRHSDSVTGGPGAIMVRDSAAPMRPDDPLRAIFGHTEQLGLKDLELVCQLAESVGVDSATAEMAAQDLPAALGLDAPTGSASP